jgi:hypothetical protein
MLRHYLPLLLLAAPLFSACTPKTRPAQIFPGFESAPADRLTTLRESDSIYISAIDNRNAPEPDWNMVTKDQYYRQFQIPAGIHLIAIYFHSGGRQSHSYNYVARVQPGHTYSFKSKVDMNLLNVVGVPTRNQWHAQLIDDATGLPPTTQPATTQPTTSPTHANPAAASTPTAPTAKKD